MPLTDSQIKSATTEKKTLLADGGGLYLADVLREEGRATRTSLAADVVNDVVVARASVETSQRVVTSGEGAVSTSIVVDIGL